jgi:chromosome segregation ATPase|tara:strand:+ start:6611 stop:7252 length:642 start_codon:yes stop_codon:yes gene_type:complete
MNNVKQIADLLPEGLDESTVESIFQLVDSTINEQVQSQVRILESKVTAYLRTKVEDLKTQALTELSEESEVFRNARLFESVRSLMALELSEADEENAVNDITSQYTELQEEFDVLSDQINSVVVENEKLEGTVKVLSNKVSLTESQLYETEESNKHLQEEVANLEASKEEAFVSSEKAIVISNAEKEINEERTHDNEFLTDEVMKFMPFSNLQ